MNGRGLLIIAALAALVSSPAFAEEEAAGGIGFPQLDVSTYASQVFWLAVAFVVLYALMSRLALPKVGAVLEHRRAQRQQNLDQAERLSGEAGKVRSAYEQALAKAQGDAQEAAKAAEQDIADKLSAENAKFAETARKRVAEAERAIAKARQEALNTLADISADIAAEMAGKISGTQVGKDAAKKAVAAAQKE